VAYTRNRVSETPAKSPRGGRRSRRQTQNAPIRLKSRLLSERPPRIVRSRRPHLSPDEPVSVAFAKIIANAKAQVSGNIDAAYDGGNPDGVHQLRVGLRRVRSVFALFRSYLNSEVKGLDQEARYALKILGTARDLDVFVTQTLTKILRDHPNDKSLAKLQVIAEERRAIVYEDVRRLLRGERIAVLLMDLSNSHDLHQLVTDKAAEPLISVAGRLIKARHKEVLKLGRKFERLSTSERHKIRIAVKKLRYACDYFQMLYAGNDSRLYLKRLKSLQDDLGQLNDAAVALGLAEQLAENRSDVLPAVKLMADWYQDILCAREPHMVAAWNQFQSVPTFWGFDAIDGA